MNFKNQQTSRTKLIATCAPTFETYEDMEFEYEDDDFQAWCNDCEKIRIKENGFTDKAMESVKLKLVCEKCYFEIKETNT